MTRLLLLVGAIAAAAASVLLWASSRDLREPWVWPPVPTPEPDDETDTWPPMNGRWVVPSAPQRFGTGDFWEAPYNTSASIGGM